jgi:hypothetical protein
LYCGPGPEKKSWKPDWLASRLQAEGKDVNLLLKARNPQEDVLRSIKVSSLS